MGELIFNNRVQQNINRAMMHNITMAADKIHNINAVILHVNPILFADELLSSTQTVSKVRLFLLPFISAIPKFGLQIRIALSSEKYSSDRAFPLPHSASIVSLAWMRSFQVSFGFKLPLNSPNMSFVAQARTLKERILTVAGYLLEIHE